MAVSKVEVVILGLLAEDTLYGYELLERFRSRSMGFWVEVAKASVYQALRRLEQEGMITGRSQEGTEGPDRRVYRIARPGRERLEQGLIERFASEGPYEIGSNLALGFAHLVPLDDVRRGIAAREQALVTFRSAIAAERSRAIAERGPGRAAANRLLDQQEALAEAEAAWLAAFRRDLAKLRR
jgi:PadR family transcriptional regulator PadR